VSFYNETLGVGIYPTPVVGVVGIVEDIARTVKTNFREGGRSIVLLHAPGAGPQADAAIEFGSSEYAKEILGAIWGRPPALDLNGEAALQKCLVEIIARGWVESAHDCSEGGLAVALAECGFALDLGARVELASGGRSDEIALFGEDAGRVVLSCGPENVRRIRESAVKYGMAADLIGQTANQTFEIKLDGRGVVFSPPAELKQEWMGSLEQMLAADATVPA
jgi:phosphoribosylformylglycinamidine synthase